MEFQGQKKINSQILNRLNDGINSIYIDGINYTDSIFKNVMNDIINTHIILIKMLQKKIYLVGQIG